MRKKSILAGILSLFTCAVLLTAHPTGTSAASQSAYRTIFDASYYYATYPDLAKAYGKNDAALFSHFINYGIAEGRSGSAEFNVNAYRERYEDLNAAYGDRLRSYYDHYLSCGRAEGRIATANGERYTRTSAEAAAAAGTQAAAGTGVSAAALSGTYTTHYKENESRATNIKIAASRIHNVTVNPGETFSFSNTILPRTAANGYVSAPVIVARKMTTGTGGGICQVSSTLYAAMVTAGIPATERHPHSLSMSYIPQGMDATISGTALDLKFKNIYTTPIVIQASAENGTLTITISVQS